MSSCPGTGDRAPQRSPRDRPTLRLGSRRGLHRTDTLEAIRTRYGEGVAQIVADCTDSHEEPKPAWHARKEAYIASLAHKPARSLAVSLADKTHNAAAINADLRSAGEAVWSRFTGGKGGTLWYYRALANAFRAHAPGIAAERFARVVGEMEELAVRT